MNIDSLGTLYLEELRDLYSAELQIKKALPKMIKSASNAELKRAFATHLQQTEGHVDRLEQIFQDLGSSPRGKKCVGMEGVIKEGSELIHERPDANVLDAGLISKAQHIEHYELAGYGTVCAWADKLGHGRHAQVLRLTLGEERDTDRLLTQLAERSINLAADRAQANEPELADLPRRSPARKKSVSRPAGERPRA